ncbi:MAG: TIGR03790 family protein [Acidimicrobiia bacterium]|nr:TIGR03790 family protein [Acidimicrobiia bacterium]
MIPGIHCWLVLALAASVLQAKSPANVLVVVNTRSELSRRIAGYYVSKRMIPQQNVCSIQAPLEETIQRRQYEEEVEKPVRACLTALAGVRIHYIVTTQGVPLMVDGSVGKEGTAAAVDSELTLLRAKMRGVTVNVAGPRTNPFYRQLHSRFDPDVYNMYLATRLAAYRFETVKRMIDQCLKAANKGNFVLDLRGDPGQAGEDWLLDAALLLPGNRVVLEQTNKVVERERDVIAYASWGSNDPNRRKRLLGYRWLPGAIVTEFVSTNGRTFQEPPQSWELGTWQDKNTWFAGAPQSMSADYLEEGATAVTGHATEPFLGFSPRPDYLFPAYYAGRTLAESFYISIPALSWMNIVAGDPLCSIGPPNR